MEGSVFPPTSQGLVQTKRTDRAHEDGPHLLLDTSIVRIRAVTQCFNPLDGEVTKAVTLKIEVQTDWSGLVCPDTGKMIIETVSKTTTSLADILEVATITRDEVHHIARPASDGTPDTEQVTVRRTGDRSTVNNKAASFAFRMSAVLTARDGLWHICVCGGGSDGHQVQWTGGCLGLPRKQTADEYPV
jgi:hypothetical protein